MHSAMLVMGMQSMAVNLMMTMMFCTLPLKVLALSLVLAVHSGMRKRLRSLRLQFKLKATS